GQGVTLLNCPDASFNGTFVVRSVASDHTSLTFWASTPGSVGSVSRSGGVVTLTYLGQYRTVPNNLLGFSAGTTGVTVAGCSDSSFNGTFTVAGVSDQVVDFAASGVPTVLTYSQAGPDAAVTGVLKDVTTAALTVPDATINSGTARMAAPLDTWAACGLFGGSYYAPAATGRCVWLNPYAEGGQRSRWSQANLILNPVWSDEPDSSPQWPATPAMLEAEGDIPAFNKPWSVFSPFDGNVTSYESVGKTANYLHTRSIKNVLDGTSIFQEVKGGNQW